MPINAGKCFETPVVKLLSIPQSETCVPCRILHQCSFHISFHCSLASIDICSLNKFCLVQEYFISIYFYYDTYTTVTAIIYKYLPR